MKIIGCLFLVWLLVGCGGETSSTETTLGTDTSAGSENDAGSEEGTDSEDDTDSEEGIDSEDDTGSEEGADSGDGTGPEEGADSENEDGDSTSTVCTLEQDDETSEWTFDTAGKTLTFKIHGEDLFKSYDGAGFSLLDSDDNTTALSNVVISGNELTVSATGGLPRFTFRVDTYSRHVSLHMIKVEPASNLDELRGYSLELRFRHTGTLGLETLNDLVSIGGNTTTKTVAWSYLWTSLNDGSLGSVAIYNDSDSQADTDVDSSLASVWMFEGLPVPEGQTCWNESNIITWVDNYEKKFDGMSEVLLHADSLEELYALTNSLVIPNKISRVYLHTATWKFEYWPNHYGRVQVNTDVFPKGEADLIDYADYLRENGIMFHLHFLAPGIGPNDPVYADGTIDRRILGWGNGTLVAAIDSEDTTIYFHPDEGVGLPEDTIAYNGVSANMDTNWVRIGEELIECQTFDYDYDEVENIWELSDCSRQIGLNPALAYEAGTEIAGLYAVLGRNLVPAYDLDQPNSLMQELLDEYGSFLARVGLDHIHLDGRHTLDVAPGALRDFQNRLYSYTNKPVTSSTVGSSIDANMEQRFSQLRDNKVYTYNPLDVGLRLNNDKKYPATSWLHSQFSVQEGIRQDSRRVQLMVHESGVGISQDILDGHGLSAEVLELFTEWQVLAPVFDDEDAEYVANVTTQKSGSVRFESEYILVLNKNSAGNYIFTPRHIMGQTSGEDELTYVWQEKGTVLRQQVVDTSTTLSLTNPLNEQALSYVISVDHEESNSLVNPTISIADSGSMTVSGTVAPGQYLQYEASSATAQLFDENWNLLGNLSITVNGVFSVNTGTVMINVVDGDAKNVAIETQFIVNDDDYVLKTNEHLQ
ncbi:hypothetical protein N8878_07115 [Psychromonas sp.]|nr:hypothetical protein [Psychromonas sp.]